MFPVMLRSRETCQEKDHFEEEEADDLINFVENLDFDKFAGAHVGGNTDLKLKVLLRVLLRRSVQIPK